jgi:hypothetical protein
VNALKEANALDAVLAQLEDLDDTAACVRVLSRALNTLRARAARDEQRASRVKSASLVTGKVRS